MRGKKIKYTIILLKLYCVVVLWNCNCKKGLKDQQVHDNINNSKHVLFFYDMTQYFKGRNFRGQKLSRFSQYREIFVFRGHKLSRMTKFQIFRGHKLSRSVCFDKILEHKFSYVITFKGYLNTEKSNYKTYKQCFFEFLVLTFI